MSRTAFRIPAALTALAAVLLPALSAGGAAAQTGPIVPVADFAAALGNREVILTWTATESVTDFDVLRGPRFSPERRVLNETRISGAGALVFVDTEVEPETEYLYELRGYDAGGTEVLHAPVALLTDSWIPGSLTARGPNPFRAETAMSFALPVAQAVRATVHDASGRVVRTLHDGPAAAGRHDLHWSGRDDAGRRVAAGVYVLRLETDLDVETLRLVFLAGNG